MPNTNKDSIEKIATSSLETNIQKFLPQLLQLDIKLWVDGEKLRYNAPKGVMTPELQAEIVKRKAEIIAYLKNSQQTLAPDSSFIKPADRPAIIPLSFPQQRLWFINQLEPGNPAYNLFTAVRLRGKLNVPVLEEGFKQVIQRHESLRTTFAFEDEQPHQVIASALESAFPVVDLTSLSDVEQETEARRLAGGEALRPFDLAGGPLVRCALLKLASDQHILLLTMHHIISDGWSMGILFREIILSAQAYAAGQPNPLPKLPFQYPDFAIWQRNWLQGKVLEKQLGYWKKQLAGAPGILELPTDHPRPAVQTFHGAHLQISLPKKLNERLQALSRQENVTLFMTLLAAFQILLARYSGQTDILVGSPVANRNRSELEGLIGFFVNTLILRADISGDPSFRELLQRVRKTCLDAYEHQDVPFEKLVDELHLPRDLSRNPLFQVMFILQNVQMRIPSISDLEVEVVEVESQTAQFDLLLSLHESSEGLSGFIEYNTDLFDEQTIARMFAYFHDLLTRIVANPQACLSQLLLLTKAEQQMLLAWNSTNIIYPHDPCLHQLIEAQVQKTPDIPAVTFEGQTLTYRALNERANQLAHFLQSQGVGPETLVGICIERSLEMVIGLLGILKAGGAYVPLDPSYPRDRLAYMLTDAKVSLLLTQERLTGLLPEHSTQVICLDQDWETLVAKQPATNPKSDIFPTNLAYMIYTSGSTGKPKGAMNTHLGICNRLLWMQEAYSLTDTDRVLQKTPFSFDVSVWEFFWPLMMGAQLVMARPEGHKDSAYLVGLIVQEQITTLHFVPAMLRVFLEEPNVESCTSLKRVICSGEALPYDLQEKLFSRLTTTELHNLYGPTEAAVDVTYWACSQHGKQQIVPIGRPIANTQIHILDKHLRPLPIGVPGELYIGGVGVGRGYHNRPDLTAERFIPTPPFPPPLGTSPMGGDQGGGGRLYRTGDLARWFPDGSIEYLGRIDFQVKLRGFRIELGEIEAALSAHPAITEAVVVIREDNPDHKQLVAYIVTKDAETAHPDDLRRMLQSQLPEYMLPSAFVFLEQLPLSPNGKIDRKALPVPETPRSEIGYVAPRNQAEETLSKIWKDILHIEQVGIYDNFFEIGGDSLLVIRVVARARIADLYFTPQDVFQYQTIAELAMRSTAPSAPVEEKSVNRLLPITVAQKGFFLNRFEEERSLYLNISNLASLLEVPPGVRPEIMQQIVDYLWRYHDVLRTRFAKTASGWQQLIPAPDQAPPVPFSYFDFSDLPPSKHTDAIENKVDELQHSLDIVEGPLMRVALFNLGPNRPGRLLIILHHLIHDASSRIFFDDFYTLTQQANRGKPLHLGAKTAPIWQWLERLDTYVHSPELHSELAYWTSLPWNQTQALPVDYPENQEKNTWGSVHSIPARLSQEETNILLREIPRAYKVSVVDILMAALVQTVGGWTGGNWFMFDTVDSGYNAIPTAADLDLSRTMGWFSMAGRIMLKREDNSQLIKTVKAIKTQLQGIPNRGVGYELLHYDPKNTQVIDSLRHVPWPDILFNYLSRTNRNTKLKPAYEYLGLGRDPRDRLSYLMYCSVSIWEDSLVTNWRYSRNLYKNTTIKGVAENYVQWLRQLIAEYKDSK